MIEWAKVLAPTIAALLALAKSIANGRKSNEIKILVNGELTAVKAELHMANVKIAELQEFIVRMSK